MKRFLSVILCAALLLMLIPCAAAAVPVDDPEVTVVVDGTEYTAHIGDIVRYTYLLSVGGIDIGKKSLPGRVSEVEGVVNFSGDSLKLLTSLEEDANGRIAAFPTLITGTVIAYSREDRIKYNAVRLKGFIFDTEKILLQLDFQVVGKEKATIDNHLKNLGSGEVKMIYLGKVNIAPYTSVETKIFDRLPSTDSFNYSVTDKTTGISIFSEKKIKPTVKAVPLSEPDYVVSDAELNRMYDLTLPEGTTGRIAVAIPAENASTRVLDISTGRTLTEQEVFYDSENRRIVFLLNASGRIVVSDSRNELSLYDVGNMDFDDVTCIIDVTVIQKALCEMLVLTPTQELLADFNGDKEVNIFDASDIQRDIAGLSYVSCR